MSRNVVVTILGLLAVLVIVWVLVSSEQASRPALQIETDKAKVSIGSGGISVSVAPESSTPAN